jgi:hypothetical protein
MNLFSRVSGKSLVRPEAAIPYYVAKLISSCFNFHQTIPRGVFAANSCFRWTHLQPLSGCVFNGECPGVTSVVVRSYLLV